jgi:aminopeptidase N
VKEPRVKAAILEALGDYKDGKVGEKAIKYLMNKEEAYSVRALSAYAIGKSKYDKAVEIIRKYIDEPSYADIIRIYCLRGLGEYGGDEAYELIKKYTSKEYGQYVRMVAIEQLGNFPEKKKEVIELLKEYAYERNRFVRRGVINACKKLAMPEVIPILDIIINREKMGFVWKPARMTKKKLSDALEKGLEYRKLRDELEKIREETRRLGEKLEVLESKYIS